MLGSRLNGQTQTNYTYDPVGNPVLLEQGGTTLDVPANALNQPASANGETFTHDAAGNLRDDGTYTYTWDAAQRLVSITRKDTGASSHFAYDGFSRRVRETETDAAGNSRLLDNLWCGERLCAQTSATGSLVNRFYRQGETRNGIAYRYAQDQVGSVVALIDRTGKVAGRTGYTPYGQIDYTDGLQPKMAYAGLYLHEESGLYLATYRGYNPATARWLNRDPIAELGGLNLYEYVRGNPITNIDIYGLWSVSLGMYDGIGGEIVVGQDPVTSQFFYGGRLGLGVGGGITIDPDGRRPGSDESGDCGHGTSAGTYVSVGATAYTSRLLKNPRSSSPAMRA